MSIQDELIKEAAEAIREVRRAHLRRGGSGDVYSSDDLARAAFAVFEKAHTPTDDEREALIECIEAVPLNQGALPRCEAAQIADAVLDALRRAEPHPLDALQDGTPSTRRAIAHAKARERLAVPQGEPSEAPCIEGGHANCERRTIDGESWTIHHPAATGQVHNAGQHAPGIDAVEDCPVCSPAVTQQGENR